MATLAAVLILIASLCFLYVVTTWHRGPREDGQDVGRIGNILLALFICSVCSIGSIFLLAISLASK